MENVKKIILDTNFLVDLFRFRLGFDEIIGAVGAPCVFLVVQQSVDELKRMKNKYARLGLSFINLGKIRVVVSQGVIADDAIISFLKNNKKDIKNIFVATNDAKLRKRIHTLDVKVIYLRARKYLEIID